MKYVSLANRRRRYKGGDYHSERRISLRSLRGFKVGGERKIKEIGGSFRGMYIRNADIMPNWRDVRSEFGYKLLNSIEFKFSKKGENSRPSDRLSFSSKKDL